MHPGPFIFVACFFRKCDLRFPCAPFVDRGGGGYPHSVWLWWLTRSSCLLFFPTGPLPKSIPSSFQTQDHPWRKSDLAELHFCCHLSLLEGKATSGQAFGGSCCEELKKDARGQVEKGSSISSWQTGQFMIWLDIPEHLFGLQLHDVLLPSTSIFPPIYLKAREEFYLKEGARKFTSTALRKQAHEQADYLAMFLLVNMPEHHNLHVEQLK